MDSYKPTVAWMVGHQTKLINMNKIYREGEGLTMMGGGGLVENDQYSRYVRVKL